MGKKSSSDRGTFHARSEWAGTAGACGKLDAKTSLEPDGRPKIRVDRAKITSPPIKSGQNVPFSEGACGKLDATMPSEPTVRPGFFVDSAKINSPAKKSVQNIPRYGRACGKLNATMPSEPNGRPGFRGDHWRITSPAEKSGKIVSLSVGACGKQSRPSQPAAAERLVDSSRITSPAEKSGKIVSLSVGACGKQSRPSQPEAAERLVDSSRSLSEIQHVSSRGHATLCTPLRKFFKNKVSLTRKQIKRNSKTVNDFLDDLLPLIHQQDEVFGLRKLNTGSYYEGLKVSQVTEFDTMLVFDFNRFTRFFNIEYNSRDPATMLFAKLRFKDHVHEGRKQWGLFLSVDGKYLSPEKLLERFISLVREAVDNLRRDQEHWASDVRQNGPAVTLTIDGKIDLDLVLSIEILEWPECASGWGDFSSKGTWPTRSQVEEIKMSKPRCYLVPKHCEAERSLDSRVFWRISFSAAEKKLLWPESSDKKYYRIVKAIFQAKKKELTPLTSFHLKNMLLLRRSEKPDDSNLAKSVVEFLQLLISRLTKGPEGFLPHFFVSRVNLLATISQDDRLNIARKLRNYLEQLEKSPESFLGSLDP